MTLSRLDTLYLARVADQAERYHGAAQVDSKWTKAKVILIVPSL